MSWTVPRVWVVGEEQTAAKLNEVSAALNDLDRRTSPAGATVAAIEGTTSTTPTDLTTPGPAVAVQVGSTGKMIVAVYANFDNSTAGAASYVGFALSGASTVAATPDRALMMNAPFGSNFFSLGESILQTALNPGLTTVTAKYWVGSGGITASGRRVLAQPLGS